MTLSSLDTYNTILRQPCSKTSLIYRAILIQLTSATDMITTEYTMPWTECLINRCHTAYHFIPDMMTASESNAGPCVPGRDDCS